jgi:hypothetical protein
MKKAYKKHYRFLSPTRSEKYSLFLKQKILELQPKFFVVVKQRTVNTPHGTMFALRITTDIECPNFEPIAECWINGSNIYLWRDRCWGIAVDKNNREIASTESITDEKTILLYPIGVDKIE